MSSTDNERTIEGSPSYGNHSMAHDLGEQYRELHRAEFVPLVGPQQAVVLPAGRKLHSLKPLLDEYLGKPERRVGTSKAFDLASFIALVLRFSTVDSVVFADPDETAPRLTAVFDYHPSNSRGVDKDGSPPADWLKHRATYAPALSDDWTAWEAKDGTFMNQIDFAAFIENQATSLIVPNLDDPKIKTYAELVQGSFATPSQLIGLSRGLEVSVGIKAKSAIRLSSGEIAMQWEESHADGAGQPIKVPSLFQICIPVFYAGAVYRLAAKLRYRVSAGTMAWAYELIQPELAFKDAFDEMAEKVRKETSQPVILGAPEQ